MSDLRDAALWIIAAVLVGCACAVASHLMTRLFYFLGATENPASYLAYLLVLAIMVFVVSSIMGRIGGRRCE